MKETITKEQSLMTLLQTAEVVLQSLKILSGLQNGGKDSITSFYL